MDIKKQNLTEEQKKVLFEKGTEPPFTGEHLGEKRGGKFSCANCGVSLFASDSKFESGTGWPSFDEALPGSVEYIEDNSHGLRRTEVVCSGCGGHLGHIFTDGPTKTGKRYCINSVCLGFSLEDER